MAPPQQPASPPAITRRCVLIVEDNALNMKLFSAMISAQDCEVLQAENGSRALELARRRHPDLIIMDLQLPDMSGLEVTRALKAAADTREIPVIATTAFTTSSDEAASRASGCDAFMAKPIAISEFLELVETLLLREVCVELV